MTQIDDRYRYRRFTHLWQANAYHSPYNKEEAAYGAQPSGAPDGHQ
jgi:hypothetical protein